MQLVISIFLGTLLGYGIGFTIWAEHKLAPIEANLNVPSSKSSIKEVYGDSADLWIETFARNALDARRPGHSMRDLEISDFDFVRPRYGSYGAFLGGCIGAVLCVLWSVWLGLDGKVPAVGKTGG